MAAAFEGWAVIELMGHRVRYGKIAEVIAFGAPMMRIDIPSDPPRTEFYGGSSIFSFQAITEEMARDRNKPFEYRIALPSPVDYEDEPEDADLAEVPDQCGSCGEPIANEAIERVAIDDGSDHAIWHKRCAEQHAEPTP